MRMYQFWDKYDRCTTYKSFFDISYTEFIPELSKEVYEQIVSSKLCEDLSDDFLNSIKVLIIRSLELFETTFTSELCLCSENRLVRFMQNVLEYVKIERVYLYYLEHPFTTGLSVGENNLNSSLLRLMCLVKDFKLLFEFESKSQMVEDFENLKDLVYKISEFFKTGFKQLSDSYNYLKAHQKPANYNNEYRIMREILSLCEKIQSLQSMRKPAAKKSKLGKDNTTEIEKVDEIPWLMRGEISKADYKTQMLNCLQLDANKHEGLNYQRLEPDFQFALNSVGSYGSLTSHSEVSDSRFATNESDYNSVEDLCHKKYNFNKYDKEIKDKKQSHKEDLSISSILTKRHSSQLAQELGILNFTESTNKIVSTEVDRYKKDRFPLTSLMDIDRSDQDISKKAELLSLVDFDYDPNTGWKVSTNPQQQEKLKQYATELELRSQNDFDQTPRIIDFIKNDRKSSTLNSRSNTEQSVDDKIQEKDIRVKRMQLQSKRTNLNAQSDAEFQTIETRLNVEPITINNYSFYENIYSRYEKPEKEYVVKAEKVIARPIHEIFDVPEEYFLTESSPKIERRRSLSSVHGNNSEEKIFSKDHTPRSEDNSIKTANNKVLETDGLKELSKQMETNRNKAFEKSDFADDNIYFFIKNYEDQFKRAGVCLKARKARIDYLWQVMRDFLNIRIFFRKNFRKTGNKDSNALAKLKDTNLLQNLLKEQESLTIHKTDKDSLNCREKEIVGLNIVLKP